MLHKELLIQIVVALIFIFAIANSWAAQLLDATPRVAVISAYEPEWVELQKMIQERKDYIQNGTRFVTGKIEKKPVLLFLCGVSMVNAAMMAQYALDHFKIDRIVFSGIAGGIDPTLSIGDVVVPKQWSQHLEMIFAKEKDGNYTLPKYAQNRTLVENYGMMFPQPVETPKKGRIGIEERFWFPVDKQMMAIASKISHSSITLKKCTTEGHCLSQEPKVIVGGNGVSGQAFVDNRQFREYMFKTFKAKVHDMETAAIAHVAYVNNVPFIAFRSLSDLAGGGAGENEEETYSKLASDNAAIVVKLFLKALPS
jgi:adenosylhomocysteine nucleosidase